MRIRRVPALAATIAIVVTAAIAAGPCGAATILSDTSLSDTVATLPPTMITALTASDPGRVAAFAGNTRPASPGDDGSVVTIAHRLGRGYWPARDLHVSPYLEFRSRLPGPWAAQIDTATAGPSPGGQALAGAMAGYGLAPLWSLSFDLAAGVPMSLWPGYHHDAPLAADPEREDGLDGGVAWHTGLSLDYALGRNFSAFSGLWAHSVQRSSLLQVPGRDLPTTETAFRLGLTFRFK
jgi:hypothetical protein